MGQVAGDSKVTSRVLLLASRYDLTTDLVVAQLRKAQVPYLRLNSEDVHDETVDLDPARRCLVVTRDYEKITITPESLRSVFFRRPVFLRDSGNDISAEDRFAREQWASLMRNLMLFEEAHWINSPASTYRAEHKAVQLAKAVDVGFSVPVTHITNSPDPVLFPPHCVRLAIKGLDTVFVRVGSEEAFGFTTFETRERLQSPAWQSAPATIQEALEGKLDIRATVVGEHVFAACIERHGESISDDWRLHKPDTTFRPIELPAVIAQRCRDLLSELGLAFGAIDIARCGDEYFFLEINPTGEWAWLVEAANLPIDACIARALTAPLRYVA
jgi:glutathione synthase/RimK-type ligase-like ATP-grasp enzyme